MRSSASRTALLLATSAILLTACGKGTDSAATPAAATVNGTALPTAIITAALGPNAGNQPMDQVKQASRQVLENMIDQQLLAEQAQGKKLDKDARVEQILAANRRELLARAYLEQLTGSVAKPTEEEIKAFFEANPLLFKEHKIYNLRELSVAAKPDFSPALQEVVAKAKSLEEVATWLKSKQVPFTPSVAAKPAEQLPLPLLPKFAAMKDGETVVITTDNGLLVEQLASAQAQPVDLAAAKPFIERVLTEQKRTAAIQAELKTLRQAAKIEYAADYTPAPPPAPAPAQAPAPAK